ncbi:Putative membrane protein [Vibrio coralliirubri]|uniref:PACE efflux transporter n=1 Tax=Vibrio coralliirubri TaxID=1516159 RepID=UPI00063382F0|nr:PACE efflux transporter [Vibrio coralliirubri]CDT53070.1 Putative membrane protein [Vibrio coralliirubri]
MGTLERVFQAILFEVLAVIISIVGLALFTNHDTSALSGTMIMVATIAMIWNFVFNWVFDQFAKGDKTKRTFLFRVFHVTLFEIGLLVLTIPVIAHILGVGFMEAFWMDVGVSLFLTVYAFLFNLIYDNTRAKIIKKSISSSASLT